MCRFHWLINMLVQVCKTKHSLKRSFLYYFWVLYTCRIPWRTFTVWAVLTEALKNIYISIKFGHKMTPSVPGKLPHGKHRHLSSLQNSLNCTQNWGHLSQKFSLLHWWVGTKASVFQWQMLLQWGFLQWSSTCLFQWIRWAWFWPASHH